MKTLISIKWSKHSMRRLRLDPKILRFFQLWVFSSSFAVISKKHRFILKEQSKKTPLTTLSGTNMVPLWPTACAQTKLSLPTSKLWIWGPIMCVLWSTLVWHSTTKLSTWMVPKHLSTLFASILKLLISGTISASQFCRLTALIFLRSSTNVISKHSPKTSNCSTWMSFPNQTWTIFTLTKYFLSEYCISDEADET